MAPFFLALTYSFPVAAADFRDSPPGFSSSNLFPDGSFDADYPSLDHLLNAGHSDGLRALTEPRMPDLDPRNGLFRLTVLPHRGTPFAFRVTQSPDGFILHYKQASGFAGYRPGRLADHRVAWMPSERFAEILMTMQELETCAPHEGRAAARGGALWVIESLNGGYCAQAYSSPKGETPRALFDALAASLVSLPREVQAERHRLGVGTR